MRKSVQFFWTTIFGRNNFISSSNSRGEWHKLLLKKRQNSTHEYDVLCQRTKHGWKKWVMRKFLICSIALSTWIRKVAIRLVPTTSLGSSCVRPPRKAGILQETLSGKMSSMSNPRSAMTESPGSSLSKMPDLFVISLSDMRPPYSSEMNDSGPLTLGVHPTRIVNVFLFL